MNEIILVGGGGHARSCIDVIEEQNKYKISGIIDKEKNNQKVNLGYNIIGNDGDLPRLRKNYQFSLITLGQILNVNNRVKIYSLLKSLDYRLPIIISPHAYVSKKATIDEGTIVMHGAVVNSGAIIGANCIINSQSLIEHDAVIEKHCHISTGAIINGEVSVGEESFIGSQVVTRQLVSIGKKCIIGAGAKIINNVKNDSKIIQKN